MRPLRLSSGMLALITCCGLLLADGRAYAYIDPGTGSFLFQCVIGAVLAGAFALRTFRDRIKSYLRRLFGKAEDQAGE